MRRIICKCLLIFHRLALHSCCFTLQCRRSLVWCSPIYLFLLLLPMLRFIYKKSLLWPRIFLPMFSSRNFTVSGHTFKLLNVLWVDFCVWLNMKLQFHSLACKYAVFLIPFIEGTVLFHFVFLLSHCCERSVHHKCVEV